MNIQNELNKRIKIFNNFSNVEFEAMAKMSNIMIDVIRKGGKVLTAGNGGNGANAQHITGDIVGRYKIEREAFAGLSLTVDPSVITAVGNDYGYDEIFARQIEGLGAEGDVLIILSSSAHSKNLVRAIEKAKEKKLTTLAIIGNNGGNIVDKVDVSITFPFKDSDLVEETAMAIFHIVLMDMEEKLTKKLRER